MSKLKIDPMRIHSLLIIAGFFFLFPIVVFSQPGAKWATGGNSTGTGDFLGTTNNQPLLFKVNNLQRASISTSGILQVNSLSGTGGGFATLDASGNLQRMNFNGNSTMFLGGDGTFHTFSSAGGWTISGNNLINTNPGFVGIGTNSPQYLLDVSGDARVNGTLYAMGLVLATKMQADTVKGTNMISVNNNFNLSGGLLNEVYTYNGDVRIQSRAGYNGNTIFSAGTTGNVGIGTYTPQYKLDVNGDERVNGKLLTYRIVSALGDSVIRLGDSTIVINYTTGRIFNNSNLTGLGIGQSAFGTGARSTAIGYRVRSDATATNSITIGSGVTNGPLFSNSIPNSLAVAFNSNIPTLFVGASAGNNTVGRVGIGTTNPQSDFQVGNNVQKVTAGSSYGLVGTNGNTFSNAYVGFNVARIAPGQWKTENDGGGNGGSLLLGDMGGGLRIICIPSTGPIDQTPNDQFIADHTKFHLRNDGRVVIGSETMVNGPHDQPNTLLTVDGTVICRELFVTQNNWADSVLSATYPLISLDSVRNYVAVNGHLPGVPSEQEVKTNGSNLAQTDVVLLAKIEELTLYMLQLQKQNAEMQKEIDELKKNKQ